MNKNIYTPIVGIFTSNEISRYYRRICENLKINNIVFYEFNQVNKNLDFYLFDHENQIESVNDYSNVIDSNLKDLKIDYNFSKLEIEKNYLCVICSRSKQGQAAIYPVSQIKVFRDSAIEVISPALNLKDFEASQIQELALKFIEKINFNGTCEIVFENSTLRKINFLPTSLSKWTIENCVTDVFENHVRAVLNLPLGSTKLLQKQTVLVTIMGGNFPDLYKPFLHVMAREPEIKIELYDKEFKVGETLGHVSISGTKVEDLLEKAHHVADYFNGKVTE